MPISKPFPRRNNPGKTAPKIPKECELQHLKIQAWRKLPVTEFEGLKFLFYNLDPDRPIVLKGHTPGRLESRLLRISAPHNEIGFGVSPQYKANGGSSRMQMPKHSEERAGQASSVPSFGPQLFRYEGTIKPRRAEAISYSGKMIVNGETVQCAVDASIKGNYILD